MTLHWLIAALIIINVALGLAADWLPDEWVRLDIDTHKSIGITVLGLAILRLIWRFRHQPPALPASFAAWELKTSHITHVLLYVLMFALPLSGWLHDSAWKDAASHPMTLFHLVPWPRIGYIMQLDPPLKETLHTVFGLIHKSFGFVLYALLALHVAGALKHEWIDKEPVLRRMWP
jgi:cytochrome b561